MEGDFRASIGPESGPYFQAGLPCGEYVSLTVLNVANVERTGMSFSIHDSSYTTQVTTGRNHAQVAWNLKKKETN